MKILRHYLGWLCFGYVWMNVVNAAVVARNQRLKTRLTRTKILARLLTGILVVCGFALPAIAQPELKILGVASTLVPLSTLDRDAMGRVAYAEAGDEGDSGLAGVVFTVLNRLASQRWGTTVQAVVNAPNQFEPVTRAGGDWRYLRALSRPQQARIDTILNLALEGRLPDLTNGARYFQNPKIVSARAKRGQTSPGTVDFGGAAITASIGAHRFYVGALIGPPRHKLVASLRSGVRIREVDLAAYETANKYYSSTVIAQAPLTPSADADLSQDVIWIRTAAGPSR